DASDLAWRNASRGSAAGGASAAGAHAAAPPSAARKSRRPMVTVIRPSRARGALKGRIPRLQCAVFTFKEGRMLVAVVSGSKAERLGFPLCPRKRTYLPILELLPSPTLGERRHRGHARRLVP